MLNTPEIIVIGGIALIMFGSKKLPELARSLGQGIREFKKASSETADHLRAELEAHAPPPRPDPDPHALPAGVHDHAAGAMTDHLPAEMDKTAPSPQPAPSDPAKV